MEFLVVIWALCVLLSWSLESVRRAPLPFIALALLFIGAIALGRP